MESAGAGSVAAGALPEELVAHGEHEEQGRRFQLRSRSGLRGRKTPRVPSRRGRRAPSGPAASAELQFEVAVRLRDEIRDLKHELRGMHAVGV